MCKDDPYSAAVNECYSHRYRIQYACMSISELERDSVNTSI